MTKPAYAILALLWLLPRCPSACEDIAVLYGDARYLLLDGDTLAVADVGNLRWLGVWRVQGIIPGSNSGLFAVSADHLSREHYRGDETGRYPSKLVVVEGLAETDDTRPRVEIGHYDIGYAHARWIGRTDLLAAWREKASRFSVLGKDLKETEGWNVSGYDPDAMLACRNGDRLVVGGSRTRFEEGHGGTELLAFPQRATKCRTTGTLSGCLAGFECRRNGKFVNGVLDLADNAVVSAFEYESSFTIPKDPADLRPFARFKDRLLSADGKTLLQQEMHNEPVPGTVAYKTSPTSRLRVLGTASGSVVNENNAAPAGRASRLFCPGGRERFVVSGAGEAHLVDLETLEIVATASIPQGRPWVF